MHQPLYVLLFVRLMQKNAFELVAEKDKTFVECFVHDIIFGIVSNGYHQSEVRPIIYHFMI